MQVRMIRIYNRVQDAGESLQPDPHVSGIPHTYKAGAGDPWPAPDPEPMACTGHTGPRAHGLHRRRDTLATRSPDQFTINQTQSRGPGRRSGDPWGPGGRCDVLTERAGRAGAGFPGAGGKIFPIQKYS